VALSCALTIPFLCFPADALADQLHFYGPSGSPTERRGVAVLEDGAGRCVPAEEVRFESSHEGVEVILEDQVGPCARWIRLRASGERPAVTIEASAGDASARRTVSLGLALGLQVSARREGRALRVRIEGAATQAVEAVATWREGSTRLERQLNGTYTGRVPPATVVVVVARHRDRIGAAVLPGRGAPSRNVLLLVPSDLAVPRGGADRIAAFVAVTDPRGRLSPNIPLRVQSERGQLSALEWLEDGLAAVALRVDGDAATLDLHVSIPEGVEAHRELPVVAGWPASVTLAVPAHGVEGEPITIEVTGQSVEGEPLDGDDLLIRCGGTDVGDGDGPMLLATAGLGGRALTCVGIALVDGRHVPLAATSVAIAEATVTEEPHPRSSPALVLGMRAAGGADIDGRGFGSLGLSAGLRLPQPFRPEIVVRWSMVGLSAEGVDPVQGQLSGEQHAIDGLVGVALLGDLGKVVLRGGFAIGGAFVVSNASLGSADASGSDARFVATGEAGVALPLGDFELSLVAGGRIAADGMLQTWSEPILRLYVEAGFAWVLDG